MSNFIFLGMGHLKGFMKAQINLLVGQAKRPKPLNLILLAIGFLLLQQKEVSLNFNINGNPEDSKIAEAVPIAQGAFANTTAQLPKETAVSKAASSTFQSAKAYIGNGLIHLSEKLSPASKVELTSSDNISNSYSNMTYQSQEQPTTLSITPTKKENGKRSAYLLKRKKQESYVDRFHKVAQSEMRK
ncbi:MAG: hypothetical protein AB8F74_22570, partial [Saprospiraceae bacterium]